METEDLRFSHWVQADLPLARMLWGDTRVAQYICAAGAFDETEVQARLSEEIARQQTHGVQYWPVFDRRTDAFAGCCGLRPFGAEPGEYEFGVHLLPGFWGRGLASQGGRAVIAYAFGPLDAKAVYAGHHPHNDGSRKMLTRLGFRYLYDSLYPPTGLMHPAYRYEPTSQ